MSTFWRACLLAGWLIAASCVAAGPVPHTQEDTERQLLVMLHMPASHFRPDATYGSGYSGDGSRQARRRIAEQLAAGYGLKLVADWPMPTLGIDCFVMQPETDGPLEDILAGLMRDARVEWAQRMSLFHPLEGTGSLYAVQPSAKFWHLAELHRVATGRRVTVAVVDSGVDDSHPDLAGRIAGKENFADPSPYASELHGTAVAGIIGARGTGVLGVAPAARLMALRGCWQEPDQSSRCSSFTLGKALNFAILNGADIINLSLAGPPDRLLQRLLDQALARGITVIGAADPDQSGGGFPASYPGVIAVAEQGAAARPPVGTLLAPGRDIPTAAPGARWRFVSGSSYAAAHVAGLAALVAELQPGAAPAQIRRSIVAEDSLVKSAREAQAAPVAYQGGIIDACATIARLSAACACSCGMTNALKASN